MSVQINNPNTTRPSHHLHDSNEPLPGAAGSGAQPTFDYTPDNIERLPNSALDNDDARLPSYSTGTGAGMAGGAGNTDPMGKDQPGGMNPFNAEGPLDGSESGGIVRDSSTYSSGRDAFNSSDRPTGPRDDPSSTYGRDQSDSKYTSTRDQGNSFNSGDNQNLFTERNSTTTHPNYKPGRDAFDIDKSSTTTTDSHYKPLAGGQNAFNSDTTSDDGNYTTDSKYSSSTGRDQSTGTTRDSDHFEGKASTMDKIVGKTQKVIGTISDNKHLQEKGQLRATGGKDAVAGAYD